MPTSRPIADRLNHGPPHRSPKHEPTSAQVRPRPELQLTKRQIDTAHLCEMVLQQPVCTAKLAAARPNTRDLSDTCNAQLPYQHVTLGTETPYSHSATSPSVRGRPLVPREQHHTYRTALACHSQLLIWRQLSLDQAAAVSGVGNQDMADGTGTNTPGAGGGELHVGEGTLQNLKKQLDEILADVRTTPATQKEIQASAVGKSAYGDFPGAQLLAQHQAKAQEKLEAFSRIFGEQIEALSISAQIADRGYENVEAEAVQRLRTIHQNALRHYEATQEQPQQDKDQQGVDKNHDGGY